MPRHLRALLLLSAAALAACKTGPSVGVCEKSADCSAGAACDLSQSPPVCVKEPGCFPACPAGQVCSNAQCVAPTCNPACDSASVCDPANNTCKPADKASVVVTSPAAGAYVGRSIAVTGTASAPGGVSALSFEARRGGATLATATGSKNGAASWASVLTLLPTVADGEVQLFAIATTGAGDVRSDPVVVTLDGTAPFVAPASDGRLAAVGGGKSTLTFTLTDPNGAGVDGTVARLEVMPDAPAVATATVPVGGVTRFDLTVGDTVVPDQTSATLKLKLTVTDKAGNTTIATADTDPRLVLRVDRIAPTLQVAAPGAGFVAQDDTVSFSGTVTDLGGSQPQSLTLLRNGTKVADAALGASAGGSATWTASLPLAPLAINSDGPVALVLRASDGVGNSSDLPFTLNVDALPPVISNVAITQVAEENGVYYTPGTDLTLTATVTDGSGAGVGSACLVLPGESGACAHPGTAGANGLFTFTFPRPATVGGVIPDGTQPYLVQVVATDALARNAHSAVPQTKDLRFKQVSASAGIVSPAAGFVSRTIPVVAKATAQTGFTKVDFELRTVGGGALIATTTATGTQPDFTGTLTVPSLTPDGPAELSAVVSWSGSPVRSAIVPVTIDGTKPVITPVTDGSATVVGRGATQFQVQFSDGGSGVAGQTARLELLGTPTVFVTATVPPNGLTTFTINLDDTWASSSKTINLKATVSDAVGNTQTRDGSTDSKLRLVVDLTGPTVTVNTLGGPYAPDATVTVSGSATDAGGSVPSSVELKQGSTSMGVATVDPVTKAWSANVALAPLALTSSTAVAFTATGKDALNNAGTAASFTINVDANAPTITSVTVAEAATNGVYAATGTDLTLTAAVSDGAGGSGVGKVCMSAPAPNTTTCVTASPYTFKLKRPADASDGTQDYAVSFTATDKAAGGTPNTSAPFGKPLRFDGAPPSVQIENDTKVYARTSSTGTVQTLVVRAKITDPGSGAAAFGKQTITPAGGTAVAATSGPDAQGFFSFNLSFALSRPQAEGPFGFTITAQDALGNTVTQSGTRLVDDAPPQISNVRVFPVSGAPGANAVTYPGAVTDTGLDGLHFLVSDTVRITGTVTDLSGVGSGFFAVDGIAVGTNIALTGCTLPATTCNFDVQIALNDARNGVLDQSLTQTEQGTFSVWLEATDNAATPGGAAATHTNGGYGPDVDATRLLWQYALDGAPFSTGGDANGFPQPGGIAIHPNGDVVVTATSSSATASTDGVWAITPNGSAMPSLHWKFGGGLVRANGTKTFGAVTAPPSIGAGTGTSALVYSVSADGAVAALDPNGAVQWIAETGAPLTTSVAVMNATVNTNQTVETVVAADSAASGNKVWAVYRQGTSAPVVSSQASPGINDESSVIAVASKIAYGTRKGIALHALTTTAANPLLKTTDTGSAVKLTTTPFLGLSFNGTSIYAPVDTGTSVGSLYRFGTGSLGTSTGFPLALPTGSGSITSEVVVTNATTSTAFFGASQDHKLYQAAATTVTAPGFTAGGVPMSPLVGASGRLYVARQTGWMDAVDQNGTLQWSFDTKGRVARSAALDCAGRLYLLSGGQDGATSFVPMRVYALLTEEKGLQDAAWPRFHRDSRNSGNANTGTPKYGMGTTGGCAQ